MPLSFKTVRGEVYSNCDILFGPDPITLDDETLAKTVNRLGVEKSVADWLLEDRRLLTVSMGNGQVVSEAEPQGDAPDSPPEGDSQPDEDSLSEGGPNEKKGRRRK